MKALFKMDFDCGRMGNLEGVFITDTEEGKNLLLHAVINQLEADFGDQDYDAMDELITKLMENSDNHDILYQYLSDSAQENWIDRKTKVRF